ncbi:MAG: triose-phosphate isomerase [Prevotellaceae bacterium]|jgi:triosephosphate isomerase|nr:triose-phosphate isomerase [Prevotellaceae bacterium]
MRTKIVAGNWKMNKTLQEGIAFAEELNSALSEETKCQVIVAPPFIHLNELSKVLSTSKIAIAAQDCANKASGAYTGEVSAAMIKSTGATHVILGHSERRAYYGETSYILRDKLRRALAEGLTPIFCIGETLTEREADEQFAIVEIQLKSALLGLSTEDFSKIILAYEPVWAIGTGKTATPDQAEEMHAFIRSVIEKLYSNQIAEQTSILYGGSCKPENAAELCAKPDIDGGLIGGASLIVADFVKIINVYK